MATENDGTSEKKKKKYAFVQVVAVSDPESTFCLNRS